MKSTIYLKRLNGGCEMKCAIHDTTDSVARCIACGLPVCEACKVPVKGDSYCKKCVAEKFDGTTKPERSPALAALLSFVVAGTGQMYNGQIGKGLAILFTCWLIVPWIYGIFDAHATARKINSGKIALKATAEAAVVAIIASLMALFIVFLVGLMAAIAIPNFIRARNTAMTKVAEVADVCRTNVNAIDSVKRMWARDTGAAADATPSWDNLIPDYLTKRPECPSQGTYILGSVSTPAKCSVQEHVVT
jgi:hypothetical protein